MVYYRKFLMLPHRHIGNTRPDQWLGMVDALYAIAMTLLALEVPSNFFEYFNLFVAQQNTFFLLRGLYSILTYTIVFLIIYELWCYHKTILNLAQKELTRRQNLISGLLLANICLIPAWASFLMKTHVDFYAKNRTFSGHPISILILFAPLLVATAFWLVSQLCPEKTSESATIETRTIYRAAIQRTIIFIAISIYFTANALWPSIPEVHLDLIILAYIIYSFNQDSIHHLFRNTPWKR